MEKDLRTHRDIWHQKSALKTIYEQWYHQMFAQVTSWEGINLELGGGIGNLKEFDKRILSTDLEHYEWLDIINDAESLPFQNESIGNIFLFDVLHHLGSPSKFFEETQRALRPGGRVIMVEPYISPASNLVYTHFHPEPHDLSENPLEVSADKNKSPLDSNQAFPTTLFYHRQKEFADRFPNLKIIQTMRLGLFAYPLTGGFRKRGLLPARFLINLNKFEKFLEPLAPFFAFRCFIVLEKTPIQSRTNKTISQMAVC